MVNPKILCRKHLIGEHVESHMFLGSLQKKIKMTGYINKDLFEPLSLKVRHDILVKEILSRGYNHNSELIFEVSILDYLPINEKYHQINRRSSIYDLVSRCDICMKNAKLLKDTINILEG